MLQPPDIANSPTYGPPIDPIAPLRAALRGHYEIEREIGQGAFATVYLARDLKHERKVAIKVLNADPTSEVGELRFIREIRLLARLQHPNILPLHDSGHVEALLYYVMPYVKGETLRSRIDHERQLSIEDAVCTAQEAADALAYAHSQGIIHRDIKPENILLSGGHAVVADFGIARAIDVAGVRQLTRTGMGSPGTPAYMAPEQLLGDRAVDSRTDIYSLGCILYEMLTGKPPFAGKEGFVKRFTEAPPIPSHARPGLPAWLDGVIAKTLARNPTERYATATELARALALGLSVERATPAGAARVSGANSLVIEGKARAGAILSATSDVARPVEARRNWIGGHPAPSLVVAAVAVVLGATLLVRPSLLTSPFVPSPGVDSSRFVIVPLVSDEKVDGALASRATDKLYDAFRAWDGLNLVPDLKVDEAVARAGHAPRTLADAIAVARAVGAGQLVLGHAVRAGDSVTSRAELYDLRAPNNTLREVLVGDQSPQAYVKATLSLLAIRDRPAVAMGGDGLTHNYTAWSAYNRGHVALRNWDVATAESDFAASVAADPAFPVARLWLGQVRAWKSPMISQGWREHVDRAAAAANLMTDRDRLLSFALSAMGAQRFPAACDDYRKLVQLDSNDFVGWYGLGECQGLDRTVLADRSSPSGWRWRGSYDAAVKSYARALRLEPGAHALLSFERLRRLLPTAATNPRIDNPENPAFAAYPSLSDADTLAFVPYPISVFAKGLPPAATSTLNRALDHDLDALFDIATRWVKVDPENPDAFEALADVLETQGDINGGPDPAASATSAVRRALRLSSDPQQRLRLTVREGILRFRSGDYRGTSKLADSLFANAGLVDNNTPPVLISLAALTGRVRIMGQLGTAGVLPSRLDGTAIPLSVMTVAANLFANSALGVCGDTLSALRQRLEEHIESLIAERERAAARAQLMTRSLSLMVPCTAGSSALDLPPSANKLHRLQRAFARKDANGVQAGLRLVADTRRASRPTDWSIDYIFQEAWIRAAMGDSTAAMRELDRTLNSISSLSSPGLKEPAAAASVARAMVLRADLASRAGDIATARRWARAVTELWANADPVLQGTVLRMKSVVGAR